jgi:hypothetical protein
MHLGEEVSKLYKKPTNAKEQHDAEDNRGNSRFYTLRKFDGVVLTIIYWAHSCCLQEDDTDPPDLFIILSTASTTLGDFLSSADRKIPFFATL